MYINTESFEHPHLYYSLISIGSIPIVLLSHKIPAHRCIVIVSTKVTLEGHQETSYTVKPSAFDTFQLTFITFPCSLQYRPFLYGPLLFDEFSVFPNRFDYLKIPIEQYKYNSTASEQSRPWSNLSNCKLNCAVANTRWSRNLMFFFRLYEACNICACAYYDFFRQKGILRLH